MALQKALQWEGPYLAVLMTRVVQPGQQAVLVHEFDGPRAFTGREQQVARAFWQPAYAAANGVLSF